MKVNHIISFAAFYSKRIQNMNISIALPTPLCYLPQNDDVNNTRNSSEHYHLFRNNFSVQTFTQAYAKSK
jgi:hypothetical protein